jgi:hypothetical protein
LVLFLSASGECAARALAQSQNSERGYILPKTGFHASNRRSLLSEFELRFLLRVMSDIELIQQLLTGGVHIGARALLNM